MGWCEVGWGGVGCDTSLAELRIRKQYTDSVVRASMSHVANFIKTEEQFSISYYIRLKTVSYFVSTHYRVFQKNELLWNEGTRITKRFRNLYSEMFFVKFYCRREMVGHVTCVCV